MERIVCLLIFFCFKCLAQDEFIFWAEFSTKNFILFHDSQVISPAMIKSDNKEQIFVCEIKYDDKDFNDLLKDDFKIIDDNKISRYEKYNFLLKHKDKLSDCFLSAKINIKDFVKTNQAQAQSETYVKILPLRFIVDFRSDKAMIYYLK